ncbi:MAG: hypothetical protein ACJA1L_001241 [Paracoccaceae bacterium]
MNKKSHAISHWLNGATVTAISSATDFWLMAHEWPWLLQQQSLYLEAEYFVNLSIFSNNKIPPTAATTRGCHA